MKKAIDIDKLEYGKWIKVPVYDTIVLIGHGFYISFLQKAWDTGGSETALVVGYEDDTVYFTLLGDWRKEYEDAFPGGLEACKKVFIKNSDEFAHPWTAHID